MGFSLYLLLFCDAQGADHLSYNHSFVYNAGNMKMRINFIFYLLLWLPGLCFSKPIVLVSIAPYQHFVEQLAGEHVQVMSIVPKNTDPHHFEPTPKQVAALREASLWIRIGEPFEQKLLSVLNSHNPSLKILNVWEGLPLILTCHCHGKEEWDRHLWLSPRLVKRQLPLMQEALIQLCPQHKTVIVERCALFSDKLQSLDNMLSTILTPLKGKAVLVSHPSFSYFCEDYGLTQLSIEQEGKEPRPKDTELTLKTAQDRHVKAVITQPQFHSKSANLFAKKLCATLYLMDPFALDYVQNLERFGKNLAHIYANPSD